MNCPLQSSGTVGLRRIYVGFLLQQGPHGRLVPVHGGIRDFAPVGGAQPQANNNMMATLLIP